MTRTPIALLLALALPLFGCDLITTSEGGDDDDVAGDDDDDDDTSSEADDDDATGPWPGNVTEIDSTTVVTGDLGDGEFIDLDWADLSTVACWPGTEDLNFDGPHVFFATYQPDHTNLVATVTPDAGVDASLYVMQMGTTSHYVPPDVSSVVTCEASYDQTHDSNPGIEESASVMSVNNPYNVLIGVAGAAGVESGGFTLEVELQ
jgi:hypothetical protein